MTVVKELIRSELDGTLSFGDYTLDTKTKKDGFEFQGDTGSDALHFRAIHKTVRSDDNGLPSSFFLYNTQISDGKGRSSLQIFLAPCMASDRLHIFCSFPPCRMSLRSPLPHATAPLRSVGGSSVTTELPSQTFPVLLPQLLPQFRLP